QRGLIALAGRFGPLSGLVFLAAGFLARGNFLLRLYPFLLQCRKLFSGLLPLFLAFALLGQRLLGIQAELFSLLAVLLGFQAVLFELREPLLLVTLLLGCPLGGGLQILPALLLYCSELRFFFTLALSIAVRGERI